MILDIREAVDKERPALDLDFLPGQPDHSLDDEIVSVARDHNISSVRLSRAISTLPYHEQVTRSKGWLHALAFHDDQLEITPQNQQ